MLAARAVAQLPLLMLAPLVCWARGHHWHHWMCDTPVRVCVRCGFTVSDPHRR